MSCAFTYCQDCHHEVANQLLDECPKCGSIKVYTEVNESKFMDDPNEEQEETRII